MLINYSTKKTLLLVSIILLLSPAYAQSSKENINNAVCPKITPTFTVEYAETPILYDTSISSKELQKIYKNKESTLGYFHSNLIIEKTSTFTQYEEESNNNTCLELSHIRFKLLFKPSIFISSDVKKYDCTFARVLDHENQHYLIERKGIRAVLERIQPIIRHEILNFNNQNDENKESKNERLDEHIQSIVDSIYNSLDDENTNKHNMLDSEDNYMQEANLCSPEENEKIFNIIS